MPQLWIETWVSQYFWLLVILFLLHYYMANIAIPAIATLFKIRKSLGKDVELDSNVYNPNFDKDKLNLNINNHKASVSSINYKKAWLKKIK